MKILFVTNMMPIPEFIYFGIHVKEQIETIEDLFNIKKVVYFINGRADKLNYFKSIADIKNIIDDGNFDLVHIHYGLSALFLLFYTPKIPVIVTLHSGELYQKKSYINHIFQKKITFLILRKANKIIVLNDDMISTLKSFNKKLIKLPCGVSLNYFKGYNINKDLDNIVIGFPGDKKRKEKNYSLFKAIIDQLRLTFNIEVIEFHNLKREDVVYNLNKIDLLLMTSTVEGSPQIIKEAMACNKPIVSTSVGDIEYLLSDTDNCYVIHSFDPNLFLIPIKKILQLPIEKRFSNGRQKILDKGLDSENIAKQIFKTYEKLL